MKHQTESDVFDVIARVTALRPCGPCGRGGFDPRIPEASASAVRALGA
jgi:hypothetical protein